MAPIKLHGSPLSTATQRALVCLYEKGLEFDFEVVDMKSGAHKQEPFISMNPFGQVPAFEDGDLHLFESRAITKYIAEVYADKGTPLLPAEIKHKAAALVWAEVEAHQFDPTASKLGWELFYKPMFGLTADDAAVEENEAKLSKVLDVYESKLSKTKYLAGDSFTLADMHHIPTIHCVLKTSSKKLFESRPCVSAWVADITARPAWAKVVAA